MKLHIVFAGTPDFAALILNDLLHSEHHISAVYTQPDRPQGRGQHLGESAVKKLALSHNIPVHQPSSLKNKTAQASLRALNPDIFIVVAYGLLLPETVLAIPKFGCINIHASLLPRYRGAAPMQYAILNGDTKSGVTIMQMDKGLDTGDILNQRECNIENSDTVADLENKLVFLGSQALSDTLTQLTQNRLRPRPQDPRAASYASKITHPDTFLDWTQPAIALTQKIRAFYPKPGAHAVLNNQLLKIHYAIVLDELSTQAPGTIITSNKFGVDVATGRGVLRLLTLQLPGGRPLPVSAVLNGKASLFTQGSRFTV